MVKWVHYRRSTIDSRKDDRNEVERGMTCQNHTAGAMICGQVAATAIRPRRDQSLAARLESTSREAEEGAATVRLE